MKTIEKKLEGIKTKFGEFPQLTKKKIFEAVMASKNSFKEESELVSTEMFLNGSSSHVASYSKEWVQYWKNLGVVISGNFCGPNSDIPEFIILWDDGTMTKNHYGQIVTWKTSQKTPCFENEFRKFC